MGKGDPERGRKRGLLFSHLLTLGIPLSSNLVAGHPSSPG